MSAFPDDSGEYAAFTQAAEFSARNRDLDAIAVLMPYAVRPDPHPRTLLLIAGVLIDAERPREAETFARRLTQQEPESSAGFQLWASALSAMGNTHQARQAAHIAVSLAPNDAGAYRTLAEVDSRGWRHRKSARAAIDEALRLAPDDVSTMITASVVYLRQHRYRRAEEFARRAVELDPGNAIAHNNLGAALQGQRRLGKAHESFVTSTQLNPHDDIGVRNMTRSIGLLCFTMIWVFQIGRFIIGPGPAGTVAGLGLVGGLIYLSRRMPVGMIWLGFKEYVALVARSLVMIIVAGLFAFFSLINVITSRSLSDALASFVIFLAIVAYMVLAIRARQARKSPQG